MKLLRTLLAHRKARRFRLAMSQIGAEQLTSDPLTHLPSVNTLEHRSRNEALDPRMRSTTEWRGD